MHGALTVRVLPFVSQPDYDKLLWACDLNFVRGEDSFVRAQWAGKPFIWHIYPQDKNLHHVKLRAFLQRYAADIESLSNFSLFWNSASAQSVGGKPIGLRFGRYFRTIFQKLHVGPSIGGSKCWKTEIWHPIY